ncbi:MAG: ABC transporter ATP-binding protein [Bacteroidota bacterium]
MRILDVNNLSVKFTQKEEDFEAVKGISFSLNSGEILGLIGESGSGKSVTSQSITRLIEDAKYAGSVSYFSNNQCIDLINCSNSQLQIIRREEVAYIFQEPMTALNPLMPCGDQILESSSTKNKDVLFELLHKVELNDVERIAKSYPHELSGGQRQRIMIAMALAKKPKLLIADEPTTALDIAIQREILALLKKLSTENKMGILFITHDLLSLGEFADRIAVMYHGKIVEQNKASKILNSPKHPYTQALLESRPSYRKKGNILEEISDLLVESNGYLVYKKPTLEKLPANTPHDKVILELHDIGKYHVQNGIFKRTKNQVLEDINLKVNHGDIVGLIGESGSGKSTIAKIVLRIWEETSGKILLHKKDINSFDDLSREIQLVFQDPFSSLNPKHTIGKAISEVFHISDKKLKLKELKQKSIELIKTVGLTESDYYKYPHEFSGGQRQRICIAKALAKEPKFIVLDEAVSALDVSIQAKILNLLNQLKAKKGLTYLLISHDMNVVSYFCNKIVVLKNGRIIESGDSEELINNPKSDYTKSLLESSIN